jgi:hypothetical protein
MKGLVIASRFSMGNLRTLYVTPALYLLMATDHPRQAEATPGPQPA